MDVTKKGMLPRGVRQRRVESFAGMILNGHHIPTLLTFTFAQSATQYGATCEIAVCNKDGQIIPGVHHLDVFVSDNADGTGIVATAPATSVAAKANSGVVLSSMTANKSFRVQTLATGKFTLEILDDVTPVLLYVGATIPGIGKVLVSRKTVAGDYKP